MEARGGSLFSGGDAHSVSFRKLVNIVSKREHIGKCRPAYAGSEHASVDTTGHHWTDTAAVQRLRITAS